MTLVVDNDLSNAYIDLTFGPTWPYVRVVREFIESFCRVSFGDDEGVISEKISSSASELVENAVKYSVKDDPKLGTHVRVELLQRDGMIVLEVQNRAQREHLKVLKEQLTKLQNLKGDDLFRVYREKMLQAAEDGTTSQLGLLRILWEWRAEKLEMVEYISDEPESSSTDKVSVKAYFLLGSKINEQ